MSLQGVGQMTRKDYKAIAAVLNNHNASESLCFAIAAVLSQDNDRFIVWRFMEACGHRWN